MVAVVLVLVVLVSVVGMVVAVMAVVTALVEEGLVVVAAALHMRGNALGQ